MGAIAEALRQQWGVVKSCGSSSPEAKMTSDPIDRCLEEKKVELNFAYRLANNIEFLPGYRDGVVAHIARDQVQVEESCSPLEGDGSAPTPEGDSLDEEPTVPMKKVGPLKEAGSLLVGKGKKAVS